MSKIQKSPFSATYSFNVEGGQHTFSIQDMSISSGPHATHQDAIDAVFKAIRDWALTVAPNISALSNLIPEKTVAISSRQPVLNAIGKVREVGDGASATVLRKLFDKYGVMSNRELSEAIGFTDEHKVHLSTFSNAMAGQGNRLVRCKIALALGEKPSTLWPSLPVVTLTLDDDTFFAAASVTASKLSSGHNALNQSVNP